MISGNIAQCILNKESDRAWKQIPENLPKLCPNAEPIYISDCALINIDAAAYEAQMEYKAFSLWFQSENGKLWKGCII